MTDLAVIPAAVPAAPLDGLPRPRNRDPYWVFLARFSGESERAMRRCLDRIAAMITNLPGDPPAGYGARIPWEQLRYPEATALRQRLCERWDAPSTVNKHLSALRGVVRECWMLELMGSEDCERIRSIRNASGSRQPAGRSIHGDEMATLLAHCLSLPGVAAVRDAALVAVLQSTGMRRAEAAAALIERYDPAERAMRIIGKGNKERTVYVHRAAVPYLDRWLVAVGERHGPIFRQVDKWENIRGRGLSPRTIGHIIDLRRTGAGLPPLSTHDFRRTFIGDLIDAGGDLVQAQQLAGHAMATTTAGYDRRPERARRKAVDRLTLPSPEELSPH